MSIELCDVKWSNSVAASKAVGDGCLYEPMITASLLFILDFLDNYWWIVCYCLILCCVFCFHHNEATTRGKGKRSRSLEKEMKMEGVLSWRHGRSAGEQKVFLCNHFFACSIVHAVRRCKVLPQENENTNSSEGFFTLMQSEKALFGFALF